MCNLLLSINLFSKFPAKFQILFQIPFPNSGASGYPAGILDSGENLWILFRIPFRVEILIPAQP